MRAPGHNTKVHRCFRLSQRFLGEKQWRNHCKEKLRWSPEEVLESAAPWPLCLRRRGQRSCLRLGEPRPGKKSRKRLKPREARPCSFALTFRGRKKCGLLSSKL